MFQAIEIYGIVSESFRGERNMRIINICAVVIAISMFTMAVEYVYGWSSVKPLAEDAWNTVYQWSDGLGSEPNLAL